MYAGLPASETSWVHDVDDSDGVAVPGTVAVVSEVSAGSSCGTELATSELVMSTKAERAADSGSRADAGSDSSGESTVLFWATSS